MSIIKTRQGSGMRVVALYSLGFTTLWLFGDHSLCSQGECRLLMGAVRMSVEDRKSGTGTGTDRPGEPQT